ncbi:MAG: AraC family transcriptional regulator [Clostridiales bacterium]|nr:AraC family transcriptional regulator [Clostridiales bacterium]
MRIRKTLSRSVFILYISFLLVLLLLFVPFSNIALNSLREQGIAASQETLEAGLKRLDMELDNVYQVAHALYKSKNYSALSSLSARQSEPASGDVTKLIGLQNEYNHLFSMLSFSEDLGLVLPSGAAIACRRIHMPFENFYGDYFRVEGFDSMAAWVSSIRKEQPALSLSGQKVARYLSSSRHYIVITVPLPLSNSSWSTFCYALLDEEKITQALTLSAMTDNSALVIKDSDGNILLHQSTEELGNCVTVEAASPQYGIIAQLSIEQSYFMSQFSGYYMLFGGFVSIYVLLGVIIALYFTHKSTQPMVKLVSAATEVSRKEDLQNDSPQQNAYAFMDSFIHGVDDRLKENRLALANQEVLLKENLLERLLRGQLFMPASFTMAERYFPDFPLPCQMARISMPGADRLDPQEFSQVQMQMQEIAREHIAPGAMLHFSGDILVVFHPAEPTLMERFEAMQAHFEKELDFPTYITASRPFDRMEDMGAVFARLRLVRRFAKNSLCLILEMDNAPLVPYSGTQYITQFNENLTRAQLKPALAALDAELNAFQTGGYMDETGVQQLFFTYRHILCQAAGYARITLEKALVPSYDPAVSLDVLFDSVRLSAATICEALESRVAVKITEKEKRVLDAIGTHLGNPELSIEYMVSLLSISDKTLQRTMRSATGMTFYEYLHSKRMELAQKLLTETALSIQEVCQSCGYTSINSFYKAFQRTFAMAPNAMRKNAHEQE